MVIFERELLTWAVRKWGRGWERVYCVKRIVTGLL